MSSPSDPHLGRRQSTVNLGIDEVMSEEEEREEELRKKKTNSTVVSRVNPPPAAKRNPSSKPSPNLPAFHLTPFEEIDVVSENARCEVSIKDGSWVLEAALGSSNDSNAACKAQCIKW